MEIWNRKILDFVTQCYTSLSSLVIHMQHKTTLDDMARIVVDMMVYSSVNSKDGTLIGMHLSI